MRLILYSKPGCHLCEGLQEKLSQIQTLDLEVEVRDITVREDWFQAYQYEIPVLFWQRSTAEPQSVDPGAAASAVPEPAPLLLLPRLSPRSTVTQLAQMLQKYSQIDRPQ